MTIRELGQYLAYYVGNSFCAVTSWFGDGFTKLIEFRLLDLTIGQAIFTLFFIGTVRDIIPRLYAFIKRKAKEEYYLFYFKNKKEKIYSDYSDNKKGFIIFLLFFFLMISFLVIIVGAVLFDLLGNCW
tara:strand:+ start:880 stop:1263 length:384 start_codon:yes stop_codon:yes gene_type:complete